MSTLSEIAANLLKRERMTESASAEGGTQFTSGWDELMALANEKDVHKWQAALSQHIANSPGKRRVTMLRVIKGGLA